MHTRIGAGDENYAVRDVQLLGEVSEAKAEPDRVKHGGEKGERESGRDSRKDQLDDRHWAIWDTNVFSKKIIYKLTCTVFTHDVSLLII